MLKQQHYTITNVKKSEIKKYNINKWTKKNVNNQYKLINTESVHVAQQVTVLRNLTLLNFFF